eukprot:6479211-Amphidinium_carterae.1
MKVNSQNDRILCGRLRLGGIKYKSQDAEKLVQTELGCRRSGGGFDLKEVVVEMFNCEVKIRACTAGEPLCDSAKVAYCMSCPKNLCVEDA